jgi:hypothetical protein
MQLEAKRIGDVAGPRNGKVRVAKVMVHEEAFT